MTTDVSPQMDHLSADSWGKTHEMYLMALFSRLKDSTRHSATIRPWERGEGGFSPLCRFKIKQIFFT